MDAILSATLGSERSLPPEYVEFRLCRELHCRPEDLDALPEGTYRAFIAFLNAEGRAARHSTERAEFYGQ